jgi:glycosyltransferase involved in cell wall biosynthesis
MGHGIDVAHYGSTLHILDKTFRILSIGRLSRTKGYEFLFATMEKLHMDGHKVLATIVGAPITEDDKVYEDELHELCARRGLREMVTFVGAVPNSRIAPYLARADLFVNMSQTGSLDKAVLEAMAASVPVLTSNAGLASTLILLKETCMFSAGDVDDFYKKIRVVMNMHDDERQALGAQLRSIVTRAHDRQTLIVRICRALQDKIS